MRLGDWGNPLLASDNVDVKQRAWYAWEQEIENIARSGALLRILSLDWGGDKRFERMLENWRTNGATKVGP